MPVTEVTDEAVMRFNEPDVLALGVPGGGGVSTAADLALFYQALLHNPAGVWDPDVLADATGTVRNNLGDRNFGRPASRSLGLVIAGDDGQSHIRGLGRTVSPRAFGHNGAGGQIAWADPATGISFVYLTNGHDAHQIRQGRRGVALSSLAAVCAPR
jgi:CubicO group peptidase (beta-lactamase class C family)